MQHPTNVPVPRNEPAFDYAPGSTQRARLKAAIADVEGAVEDIPGVIGGREVRSGRTSDVTAPHRHRHVLARLHRLDAEPAALGFATDDEGEPGAAAERRLPVDDAGVAAAQRPMAPTR